MYEALFDGSNRLRREVFIKGYEQAEQDLALTWEDMKRICALSVLVEMELGRKASDEQLYEEVLQRFNSYREVKK